MALPVVIDTDIGSDPDDAIALLLALASPELDVRGVTVVSGDVDFRARLAARLLGMAGRTDIPVFRGEARAPAGESMDGGEGIGIIDAPYHGPEADIDPTPASDWLLAEARRQPFHLIGIGPLTTIAATMRRDPTFRQSLLGLTVMGGLLDIKSQPETWQRRVATLGSAAWPDYNTTSDPEAALTVATLGSQMTWITLDVTMRAPLLSSDRARLSRHHLLGKALGEQIDAWHASWFPTEFPPGSSRFPVPDDAVAILHDPLAVAAVIGGSWLRLRQTQLTISLTEEGFRLREDAAGTPATIADAVDGAAFAAFCLDRIVRLLA